MVALSTADTNKWSLLLKDRSSWPAPEGPASPEYEPFGPIRQRQRRLSNGDVEKLVSRYLGGATVYELAAEFDMSRSTVSNRLKRAGIALRLGSPTQETIDEIVRLYNGGASLAVVGKQVGFAPGTVHRHLRDRGILTRDTHGSERT